MSVPVQRTEVAESVELSLDPHDWQSQRDLGQKIVGDMVDYLAGVGDRPTWQPLPARFESIFEQPVPVAGMHLTELYEEVSDAVLDYTYGNIHPRFWGWVCGTGTLTGVYAELIAATMNPNAPYGDNSVIRVEDQLIRWFAQIMGFPEDASGIIGGGGSVANLEGIAVGLHARAGFDVTRTGLTGSARPLRLYGSDQVHGSVDKAAQILGLGADSLRKIPTDGDFRMNVDLLREAVAEDRASGWHPFLIVGTAGTVNTGAHDPFPELAEIAQSEGMWFHVDGAFGSILKLSSSLRAMVDGIELADSLAFDLHKWLHVPYDAGVLLVRNGADHRRPFTVDEPYLSPIGGGVMGSSTNYTHRGLQLSRPFRALKGWMTLKHFGTEKLGKLVDQNIDQAAYLARGVEESDELELLAPAPTNVVVFRYGGTHVDEDELAEINRAIVRKLQETGIATPSHTIIDGRFGIRTAFTNHRTKRSDIDALLETVVQFGNEFAGRADRRAEEN